MLASSMYVTAGSFHLLQLPLGRQMNSHVMLFAPHLMCPWQGPRGALQPPARKLK